jgi:hypothetical protein
LDGSPWNVIANGQPKRAAINDPLIDSLTSKLPQAVVILLIIG